MEQELNWMLDKTEQWFTPGGDPVWCCPVCGGDKHVMGIETSYHEHYECKDCGAKMNGYKYK